MKLLAHLLSHAKKGGSYLAMAELLDVLRERGHDTRLVTDNLNISAQYAWADVIFV